MAQESVYGIWGQKHPASECKKMKNGNAHQQSMTEQFLCDPATMCKDWSTTNRWSQFCKIVIPPQSFSSFIITDQD